MALHGQNNTNFVIKDYYCIVDPDQTKHAQAKPDRHFLPPVEFLFQEILLLTIITLRRNVLARIILRELRRLICVDTLRRVHNVGFLVERPTCHNGTLRMTN